MLSVVLTVGISLAAGYAVATPDFPLRNTLFLAVVATLMIPVQVIVVAQFRLVVDLGPVDTPTGVVLARPADLRRHRGAAVEAPGRRPGGLHVHVAMSLLSIPPMLLVLAVFQRHFVEGVARTGLT